MTAERNGVLTGETIYSYASTDTVVRTAVVLVGSYPVDSCPVGIGSCLFSLVKKQNIDISKTRANSKKRMSFSDLAAQKYEETIKIYLTL